MIRVVSNLIFDELFSIFVTNNLDIFVWRIIWDTQDLYLQSNKYFNSIISLLIAYVLIFFVKCIQLSEINSKFEKKTKLESESKNLDLRNSHFLKNLKIKLVILLISFANINHWRCLWNFTLEYTNGAEFSIVTLVGIAFLIAFSTKRVCCFVSSPFKIGRDSYEAAYDIKPTSANHDYYLKINNEAISELAPNNWQILLSFLIEFIIDICTIHSWRGLWLYMDLHLFVNNLKGSAWTSLAIGSCIYLVVHILNKPINDYISSTNQSCDETQDSKSINSDFKKNLNDSMNLIKLNNKITPIYSQISKKILAYFMFILCYFGTVSTWRGVWNIQLLYCYPKLFQSKVVNQNFLNAFYFFGSILVLWKMNLLASLQSRSSCEDDYFMKRGNFILDPDHFETCKQQFLPNDEGKNIISESTYVSISPIDDIVKVQGAISI